MASPREIRDEMNARLPKGQPGSARNELRMAYWFVRARANSFEERLALATKLLKDTGLFRAE